MNERLEQEVLVFALDNDNVINLLLTAESKGISTREEALATINSLRSKGQIKLVEYDHNLGKELDLSANDLDMKYVIDEDHYDISILTTPSTIPRINELPPFKSD